MQVIHESAKGNNMARNRLPACNQHPVVVRDSHRPESGPRQAASPPPAARPTAVINCDCPRCGSRNTKAFPVLYQDGTRVFQYQRNGIFYYRRSFGMHSSSVRGQSQTVTAQRAAPPADGALSFGAALFLLALGFVIGGVAGCWIVAALLLALAVLAPLTPPRPQSQDDLWSSTFRCNRCGNVFVVSGAQPVPEYVEPAR